MNSNWFKWVMKWNGVQFGRNLLLKGIPAVYKTSDARLKLGDDVTIRSSFLSNLVGMYCRTIIVARMPGTVIEIGNHVGISGTAIYARKGVYIGDNTCIGVNCKILDNDFHPLDYHVRNEQLRQASGSGNALIPSKEIRIGKNCFIGCNSIILKGTVLGDGCVVGAGAVVSGEFPENCVVAGNPARVIRKLTDTE